MTQAEKLLTYLQSHPQGLLNIEMQSKLWILCYTKRLSELRRQGYSIIKQPILRDGKYRGVNRYYLEQEAA